MTPDTKSPTITLSLSLDEVNLALGALAELPIKQGVAVWSKVVQQAEAQLPKTKVEVGPKLVKEEDAK